MAVADPAAAQPPATARGTYLSGDGTELFDVLPPAPRLGDPRYEADRRIFLATRSLKDKPRWQMAINDTAITSAALLQHFACSLDIELAPQQAPRMLTILLKATRDAAKPMAKAKDYYKRLRPFQIDSGATCVSPETVSGSYDYPSGHTTAGWAWALVLAQIDPQHSTRILARGRAIGDSRVICGMHNASAVEGARMLTSAVVTVAAASPAYQIDLDAARTELAALRAAPHATPEPARCAGEAELAKAYW